MQCMIAALWWSITTWHWLSNKSLSTAERKIAPVTPLLTKCLVSDCSGGRAAPGISATACSPWRLIKNSLTSEVFHVHGSRSMMDAMLGAHRVTRSCVGDIFVLRDVDVSSRNRRRRGVLRSLVSGVGL